MSPQAFHAFWPLCHSSATQESLPTATMNSPTLQGSRGPACCTRRGHAKPASTFLFRSPKRKRMDGEEVNTPHERSQARAGSGGRNAKKRPRTFLERHLTPRTPAGGTHVSRVRSPSGRRRRGGHAVGLEAGRRVEVKRTSFGSRGSGQALDLPLARGAASKRPVHLSFLLPTLAAGTSTLELP